MSFLDSLDKYFNGNRFKPLACKQYSLFVVTFLYLKVNANIHRYYMSKEMGEKVLDARQKEGKLRHSEKMVR